MKIKTIFLSIITLLIMSFGVEVYADILPYGDTSLTQQFWGDTGLNHVINFSGNPSASHSTIILYNDAGLTYRDYVYFLVVGCRHGNDITGAVSTRSSGAKIGQMSIFNSQEACNDGYQGKITYIQYQVTLWGNVDDTGEELIADANASLYGNNYLYIMNKYFANEDQLSLLIQGQSNYNLIQEQINQSISNTNLIINNQNSISQAQIDNINRNHNEIMNSDISDDTKSLPDKSSFEDYQTAENSLKDKIKEADMSVLDIGIDTNSSNWVWTTLTSLIQSHSAIFGMFISILSIGIIKMALGR